MATATTATGPATAGGLGAQDEASAINRLKALANARTMDEHRYAIDAAVDDHVRWDAPPILLEGKDKMRVAVYLAKFVADLDFAPVYSTVLHPGDREVIRAYVIFKVLPKHPFWLFPVNWLIPREIPIHATLDLAINRATGRIHVLHGRINNWPTLPSLVRWWNGFVMGTLGSWTEEWWGLLMQYFGDHSYDYLHAHKQHYGGYGAVGQQATTATGTTRPHSY